MFRFFENLTALGDGGELERSFKEIYPPQVVLKKKNLGNHEGSFWDLLIKVQKINFPTNSVIREVIILFLYYECPTGKAVFLLKCFMDLRF